MSMANKNIDFELIWKKINSELSIKEEKLFSKWLDSDENHKSFFEKVVYYHKTGKIYDANDLNVIQSWNKTEPKLFISKRRYLPDWVKIAGSVAATVVIMLSVYFIVENQPKELEVVEIREMTIPPGTSKALLIFDDGETVDLSEGRAFHTEIDGAKISNRGNQISYVRQGTQLAELRYNILEIPRGAEYFIILSDGTKVWLNSDTRLKYPVNFIGNERVVELTGEAYFEVTKDTRKPFRVSTGGQIVEVLGTEFNVSSYTDEELIYTTLVEGRVKVFSENNPELSQNLTPGYQTYMYKESGDISIRKVDVDEYVAWKNGEFQFNNRTLLEMMGTISRWYDINVVFETDQKKKMRFTGNIKRYENLEQMLQLIEKTHEVKFEKTGDEIIIK